MTFSQKPQILTFSGPVLPQQKNKGDRRQSNDDRTRHKTAPNKPVNHIFRFKIQRAPGTTARGLFQHIATISTRLSAHARWSTHCKLPQAAIRDLLLTMRCTTLLAQEL